MRLQHKALGLSKSLNIFVSGAAGTWLGFGTTPLGPLQSPESCHSRVLPASLGRLEAIATRLGAIASRVEAIAIRKL